jgi:hypothetical protein
VRKDARVRTLYAELRDYDQAEVAEVGVRVRLACTTARPEDAEERALAITLDVLRLRHRGLRDRDITIAISPMRALDDGA